MITETQTSIIVLHLNDEIATQLQPFTAGPDITACTAGHTTVERVGSALDYDIRWQPNEWLRRARAPTPTHQ
jgi:hypothetical protein